MSPQVAELIFNGPFKASLSSSRRLWDVRSSNSQYRNKRLPQYTDTTLLFILLIFSKALHDNLRLTADTGILTLQLNDASIEKVQQENTNFN